MTWFAQVAATSGLAPATRSAPTSWPLLAELAALESDEVVTVAWLSGGARQAASDGLGGGRPQRADLGGAFRHRGDLTIGEVDATFDRLAVLVGAGMVEHRPPGELTALLRRAARGVLAPLRLDSPPRLAGASSPTP